MPIIGSSTLGIIHKPVIQLLREGKIQALEQAGLAQD
jgi:hypothetical protein